MAIITGVFAIFFGGWLGWLWVVRDWHWIYGLLGYSMVAGGAYLICSELVPAIAG
jgi:hypothetical protein